MLNHPCSINSLRQSDVLCIGKGQCPNYNFPRTLPLSLRQKLKNIIKISPVSKEVYCLLGQTRNRYKVLLIVLAYIHGLASACLGKRLYWKFKKRLLISYSLLNNLSIYFDSFCFITFGNSENWNTNHMSKCVSVAESKLLNHLNCDDGLSKSVDILKKKWIHLFNRTFNCLLIHFRIFSLIQLILLWFFSHRTFNI